MHEVLNQVFTFLHATWRCRWYAVIAAWTVALGGWVAVYFIPNRYEASARVYVDTQSVLKPLLVGVAVQPNVEQVVSMMGRTLISRPNMEKVIRMADMDIALKTPDQRERTIDRLIKDLKIGSAGRENLYTISYSDESPQQAKRIVQSLLTIFVEGSLGDKRKDSDSARRFLDEQLKSYGEKLIASENAVTEFKRQRMGLLPADGVNFYTRLAEAKGMLDQAALSLKEAENSRDALKAQLTGGDTMPNLLEERLNNSVMEYSNPELDGRISGLQQKLDSLKLMYTDQHPDIISLQRVIAQLNDQKQRDAKLNEQKMRDAKMRKPVPTAVETQSLFHQQISMSLAQAEANVAGMKARVQEYEKRYAAIKSNANALPQVEAEFTQLTRDYEVTKKNYQTLLARREQAQISGDMEANASVMDFRIIDPPQVPSTPNWPNRPLFMSGVLVLALGVGIALAFLVSQLRPTFHDEHRLREVSGLPVLGTVDMAWNDAQKSQQKKGVIKFVLSLLSLLSAYAAVMVTLALTAAKA
jgi:polysaccharide chain length determinant protein (PEP-CTERM system associated)